MLEQAYKKLVAQIEANEIDSTRIIDELNDIYFASADSVTLPYGLASRRDLHILISLLEEL